MKYIRTNQLDQAQKTQIRELWNKEYPSAVSFSSLEDFENYLSNLAEQRHTLVQDENALVKAWYFDFIRDEHRWFAMIVDSKIQGMGYGGKLLDMAKKSNSALYGWIADSSTYEKQNGEVYKSPIAFYQKHGFQILSEIKLEVGEMKTIKIQWPPNRK